MLVLFSGSIVMVLSMSLSSWMTVFPTCGVLVFSACVFVVVLVLSGHLVFLESTSRSFVKPLFTYFLHNVRHFRSIY